MEIRCSHFCDPAHKKMPFESRFNRRFSNGGIF
jgi:hypothetical protein